ncbi:MAG: YceD family protein [Gaiellaceae bacterium]
MTSIDLLRLRLRPGEVRREQLELELDPFLLGGQRYEAHPETVPAEVEITLASGATVFDLQLQAHLAGPCMRCLGYAELDVDTKAREFHDPAAPSGDDLRSDYVVEDQLEVGTWARDAIAIALPEQILCRPECAGLCPVCGKDLNAEPHEHTEERTDPRWAALESLRDQL